MKYFTEKELKSLLSKAWVLGFTAARDEDVIDYDNEEEKDIEQLIKEL
jgi:hypothetical protein